jgi:hypothetical protein
MMNPASVLPMPVANSLKAPGMPLLRQSGMADAGVSGAVLALQHALGGIKFPGGVAVVHVVEIGQILFAGELAQNIHVAVGERIGGENIMIRDDDQLMAVPHLGLRSKLAFKNADGAGTAHIMRHQDVGLHPDILPGLQGFFSRRAGQDRFSQRHRTASAYPSAPPPAILN